MPIDPTRRCPCHGEPMLVRRDGRAGCVIKRREFTRRYHRTVKGQQARQRAVQYSNSRRVRIGDRHLYNAPTAAEAQRINAHIRRRLHELKQGLAGGTQMESGTPS